MYSDLFMFLTLCVSLYEDLSVGPSDRLSICPSVSPSFSPSIGSAFYPNCGNGVETAQNPWTGRDRSLSIRTKSLRGSVLDVFLVGRSIFSQSRYLGEIA